MARLFPDNPFVAPKMGKGLRLVVAEAPGEEEAINGEPLVGGAGRWFNVIAEKAGLKREDLTLVNCINCRPPQNIFPTDAEARKYISHADAEKAVSHCQKNHVEPLLRGRNWRRIDLLGDKPLRILGGRTEGVFKWRGSPIEIPLLGSEPRAIATLHPAYIMRDQEMLPVAINDLRKDISIPPEFYSLYPSLDEVRAFTHKTFAFDIETNGWSREISMVGLCAKPYFSIVVPFRGEYVSELKRIFREADAVIGHNSIQFDLPVLADSGVTVSRDCQLWDTMLAQHLLFPSLPHDLEFVGSQFSCKPAWKDDKRNFQLYCARDVDVTLQSFQQLLPMLREQNLERLYAKVQVPLAKICHLMQTTGFKVNNSRIHEVRAKLLTQMEQEERHLPEPLRSHDIPVKKRRPAPPGTLGKSGKPVKFILEDATERVVPWRSPPTKQKYLYSKAEPWCLGFDPIVDPKTERITTGKLALEKLKRRTREIPEVHRALNALHQLNKWDELITTFASEEMTSVSRMYPHFNVHGTASGRLSSSDPNLQNIPESTRFIYVPSHPGWRLLECDYSNIENRLTAHLAGDKARLERYSNPKHSDYKLLASRAFGIPYDEVEKDNDRAAPYGKAKAIVLGTNYGLGALKISKMYDMDFKEAKRLMGAWREEIHDTTKWQERVAEQAKNTGVLTTPFGRKRWFWTANAYTESLSFLPQSVAADMIYRAMIGLMYQRIGWPEEKARQVVRVVEALPKPARLLLQVHDALVVECPEEMVPQVAATIRRVMEQPFAELNGFWCPVNIAVGESWGEVEPYS